ncbi:MAG: DUF1573 domain-containing protein [Bacteroidaceae bacterium]|nr:DUF1573 domain-containing protein [Bacteroidaceae bacterium]
MKRTLLSLLLLCVCFAPMMAEEPQAEIKFDKILHDFGQFTEDNAQVSCTFTFTNVGDAPLVITQCVASCGCTVPTYSDKPIEPGKTGQIKVTYNGKGRVFGPFTKVITVMSNAKTKMTRLSIKGEMVEKEKK